MKKIYFDTEFTGLHQLTTLISIGLVSENGSTFYAEFTDYDRSQVDSWIQENVIDKLRFNDVPDDKVQTDGTYIVYRGDDLPPEGVNFESERYYVEMRGNTERIRKELLRWLEAESVNDTEEFGASTNLQFVSDCYAYDWMLLVDLLTSGGTALSMPDYIYYIPIDLSTILSVLDIDQDVNREKFAGEDFIRSMNGVAKHNALFDACVIMACYVNCEDIIINHFGED